MVEIREGEEKPAQSRPVPKDIHQRIEEAFSMDVTIVGSGCGIPDARRASPCIAVPVGKQLFAFDCGPGALRAMDAAGVQTIEATLRAGARARVDAGQRRGVRPSLSFLCIPLPRLSLFRPWSLK